MVRLKKAGESESPYPLFVGEVQRINSVRNGPLDTFFAIFNEMDEGSAHLVHTGGVAVTCDASEVVLSSSSKQGGSLVKRT